MKSNQVEDDRRRLLIEQQRTSKTKGQKRAAAGICDTVFPLMNDTDRSRAKQAVRQAITNYTDTAGVVAYEDKDFKPYKVQGYSTWKRLKEMKGKDAKLFVGGTEAGDTKQGGIGDCWLIAAMSCVAGSAEADHSIEDAFIGHDADAGIYALQLFHENEPYAVIVDDRVPASGNREAFCSSITKNELWPAIIEKACAKFYHNALGKDDQPMLTGYEQLSGGLVYKGVRILSPTPTCCVTHTSSSDIVVSGKLWSDLKRWYACGYFIGTGSDDKQGLGDTHKNDANIVQGHAFSCIQVAEVSGFQLLKLRNPWGNTEFTGDWSDNSIMWKRYPKVKNKLNPVVADDGEFWIQFDDYVRYFDTTDCAIFTPPESWSSQTFTFTGPAPGEPLDAYSADRCPTLWLTVRKELEVVVQIEQPERRDNDQKFMVKMNHSSEAGRVRIKSRYSGSLMMRTSGSGKAKTAELLRVQDDAHVFCITWDSDTAANLVFPVNVTIQYRKVDEAYLKVEEASNDATIV